MISLLSRHPAAAKALPADIAEAVLSAATVVHARPGRSIVALGSESRNVYLVLEGRVQVAIFSIAGREVVLRDLGPGALFGELAAIDGGPRSAAITAIDSCVLASMPGGMFRDTLSQSPAAALWIMRRLVAQVRELSERIFELHSLRVPSRLHCELLRLCHLQPGELVDGIVDPSPTHAELAARIGSHREAVTRELGYLGRHGILTALSRRRWQIDLPRLVVLVQGAVGDTAQSRRQWPVADAGGQAD